MLYPTELLGHISKIFNFSAQTDSNELPLGGERSILLSYRDLYEIELVTITFGFELIG